MKMMIAVEGFEKITEKNLADQPGVWGVKWDHILAGCEVDVSVWDRSTYLITVDGQHRTLGVSKVFEWFPNIDPCDDSF